MKLGSAEQKQYDQVIESYGRELKVLQSSERSA